MPLILPGNVASATAAVGYDVANSCRFNTADSPDLAKDTGAFTGTTKGTISFWCKRGENIQANHETPWYIEKDSSNKHMIYFFDAAGEQPVDKSHLEFYGKSSNSTDMYLKTNTKFRDGSAWYHIVVAFDTTQSTETDRAKIYINGVLETGDLGTYPAEDASLGSLTDSSSMQWGTGNGAFGGYLAECVYIDGLALGPTSFGEFDSDSPTIWKPIDVSGLTFGDQGCYLDFEASGNLGNDANGGTDFDETNLAAADQATDTPTNNFCTLNSLDVATSTAVTYSEGNTIAVGGGGWRGGSGTFGVSTGKWYWEVESTGDYIYKGVATTGYIASGSANYEGATLGFATTEHAYALSNNGKIYHNNTSGAQTFADYGDAFTTEIVGVALNLDDDELTFYYDNAVQNSGTAIALTAGYTYMPYFAYHSTTGDFNFGGSSGFAIASAAQDENGYGNFEFAPPSGFLALCTKNLAEEG